MQGTVAELVSEEGKGIEYIMNLANITRIHNITNSVGYMRRIIALVEDYSKKRSVFGKLLTDQPLHLMSFSRMKFLFEGNFLLMLYISKLQGKYENCCRNCSKFKEFQLLLRLLLPIAKVYTSRVSEYICLEGIQAFGAMGYMENSGIPTNLRDTIVTSIWEGTVNTLSMDFFKVINNKERFILFHEMFVVNKIHKRITKFITNQVQLDALKEITEFMLRIEKLKVTIYSMKEFSFL